MPIGISRLLINGTPGNDLLVARPEPSRLLGGDGNDVLIDGPGSDLLQGGAGNNRLYGGLGDDYYSYTYPGRDLILDFDPTPGNVDTLIFDGVSLEEMGPFERYEDDLLIGILGEPGLVTIRHFFLDPAFRIERFRFGGFTVTDKEMLRNFHLDPDAPPGPVADVPPRYTGERIRLSGSDRSERLVAGDAATYITGRKGNDLLIGSRYSDVLAGGESFEFLGSNVWNRLYGGPGGDYYHVDYSWEYGRQWIYDYDTTPGNIDTLHVRGARIENLSWVSRSQNSLYLELDSEQRVVIENYFLHPAFVIEKIRFDDGVLLEGDIQQRLRHTDAALGKDLAPPQTISQVEPIGDPGLGWLLLGAAALARIGG